MKTKISVIFMLLIGSIPVMAYLTYSFPGWNDLKRKSPYIIIARCIESPKSTRVINGTKINNPLPAGPLGGIVLTDIKVAFVLKGEGVKSDIHLTLWSKYWPLQGEDYLLFATDYDGTNCNAFDAYRVVPLGHFFQTNMLAGKSLDEQIQTLLQYRLNNLNREIQKDEEKKARLEEGLQK